MSNTIDLSDSSPYEPTVGDIVEQPSEAHEYSNHRPYISKGMDMMRGRVMDPVLDGDGDVVVELIEPCPPTVKGNESYFQPEHTVVVEDG